MNTKRVNAAASMIQASMARGNREAYSLAFDLESAGMLQSPETAAEMAALRARVAELEAEAAPESENPFRPCGCPKRFDRHAWGCPTVPEDPHTSELHHDYALGRDDLRFSAAEIAQWQARHGVVPRQVTGRCLQGHTFEDCTCGGAA